MYRPVRTVRIVRVALAAAAIVSSALNALAAGSGSRSEPIGSQAERENHAAYFEEGMKALDAKDYKAALDHFERALREDRKIPDYLNMVAYTQRTLGKLDDA